MKEIIIEWQHYDKKGETCLRCNNTGKNIKKAIKAISINPKFRNIKFVYKEIKLEESEMPKSNTVLVNGQPVEDILNASVSENYCHSCSCLAGKGTNCRTIKISNNTYEEIPEEIILDALEIELNKLKH